ncbi:MAG: AbrB/MazE/SpoVT family DNA-binding domain-containing protein [Gammaproteobacteria bacterium]|nr:AbrB/MazE/SpoVT family DNA-binding domain-containing protein [Gammaproteobacteria bacterium]
MLARKTSKNQITLPKAVISRFPTVEYFDVREENGRIVLAPVKTSRAEAAREKLQALDITPADIDKAVAWARKP